MAVGALSPDGLVRVTPRKILYLESLIWLDINFYVESLLPTHLVRVSKKLFSGVILTNPFGDMLWSYYYRTLTDKVITTELSSFIL